MKGAPGIEPYHAANCPARDGGKCRRVECSYRASVYNRFTKAKDRSERLPTLEQAKEWQRNHRQALRTQRTAGPVPTITLAEAWPLWVAKAKAGGILARGDKPYKRRPLDEYNATMKKHILPEYGPNPMAEVTTAGLALLVSDLMASGKGASTVRNIMNPVRVLYRDAALIIPTWHGHDPTDGLKLPRVDSRRREEQIPTPEQVAALIAAAPADDRAVWATAALAGLRRGELQSLRWRDLDLVKGEIRVRLSFDRVDEANAAKSYEGHRDVPIFRDLRPHLAALTRRGPDDAVFAPDGPRARAFHPGKLTKRADAAWAAAGVERFTLHGCRHGAASVWIEAGVVPRRVQSWLGHSDISTTFNIYGKLLDRSEPESIAKVDDYLSAVGPSMGPTGAVDSGSGRLDDSAAPGGTPVKVPA